MRITFLTNLDLASNVALNLLLPALSTAHDLELMCSSSVGKPSTHPELAALTFLEQTLPNDLIFPMVDTQKNTGELLTFHGLERYLTSPMRVLNAPNSEQGLRLLSDKTPELMISIRYGKILRNKALSIPDLGVLNLHSGKLPDYRGVMATFRAMLAQEQELFSTLHWIDDDTIDTGRVISVQGHRRAAIGCYLSNTLSLYPAGCRAIINAVNALEDGEDLPNLASGGPGNYYSFPDEETIRDFLSTGYQWGGAKFLSELYSRYLPPNIQYTTQLTL